MKISYLATKIFSFCLVCLLLSIINVYAESDLSNAVDETYRMIKERVESGQLTQEDGKKAADLRKEYQRYMIQRQADLQIVKLDILDGTEKEREAALNDHSKIVAEMEHMKIYYLRQFKQIASVSPVGAPAIKKPQMSTTASRDAKSGSTSKKSDRLLEEREITWNTKDLDIVVEIKPEDITKGDRE